MRYWVACLPELRSDELGDEDEDSEGQGKGGNENVLVPVWHDS